MINLLTSEAYAFDYLAIFEIKYDKGITTGDAFLQVRNDLAKQIGRQKYIEVYDSIEYKELYKVNAQVFDLVEKAKTNQIPAKAVDDGNYARYLAKKALQARFWPNTVLSEVKTNEVSEVKVNTATNKIDAIPKSNEEEIKDMLENLKLSYEEIIEKHKQIFGAKDKMYEAELMDKNLEIVRLQQKLKNRWKFWA